MDNERRTIQKACSPSLEQVLCTQSGFGSKLITRCSCGKTEADHIKIANFSVRLLQRRRFFKRRRFSTLLVFQPGAFTCLFDGHSNIRFIQSIDGRINIVYNSCLINAAGLLSWIFEFHVHHLQH